MVESSSLVVPDRLFTRCPKTAFEQSATSLYDSGLGSKLFFRSPKDVYASEDEIILEVDAEAFLPDSSIFPVKDGCWKSNSPLLMAYVREYVPSSP